MILAIKFLHDRQILHRDLKFENVLIMADDTVKLSDFGLTKEYLNVKTTNMGATANVGTPQYIAPEVLNYQPYGKKADIYSFGIMLNEAGAILGGWNTIKPEIQKLVEAMTLMTPSQRPNIDQILHCMLDLYP